MRVRKDIRVGKKMRIRKGIRDLIAEEMTSDQVAEAQRMAREMVEANPQLISQKKMLSRFLAFLFLCIQFSVSGRSPEQVALPILF